jgi:phage baseplate assembly protein W
MINITNLTNKTSGRNYVFSDLNMDFQERQVSGNRKNTDIAPGIDLVIDYDRDAVRNSIRNLLYQKRYLTEFNINLKSYIGSGISKTKAESLGETIERGIALYEPRVKTEKILVGASIDQGVYYISIIVSMVNFPDNIVVIKSTLDRNGSFTFINS